MQGCLLSSWCILLLSLRGVVHAFPIQQQQQRWSLTTTRANYYHHDDNDADGGTVDETAVPSHNRRRRRQVVTAVLGALCGWIGASPRYYRAFADDVLLRGTVTVPADYTFQSSAALYITCRPNRADNVPRAILDGSNGKPPPVLTARLALSTTTTTTFPLSFALTTRDVTPEGQGLWWLGNNDNNDNPPSLVVSARLDTDGVAATRSPDDLVGRTISNGQPVELALTGRGAFGKFATKPQK